MRDVYLVLNKNLGGIRHLPMKQDKCDDYLLIYEVNEYCCNQ